MYSRDNTALVECFPILSLIIIGTVYRRQATCKFLRLIKLKLVGKVSSLPTHEGGIFLIIKKIGLKLIGDRPEKLRFIYVCKHRNYFSSIIRF